MSDADPSLRRVELTSGAVCAAMALVALPISGIAGAAAVLAGGLLVAVSYGSLKSGVGGMLSVMPPASPRRGVRDRRQIAQIALKIVGRYALLALLAYVMIARLRLQPVGLMAGVSSVVAAASIEAIRLQLQKKPKA